MPRFQGPDHQRLALSAWVKLARAAGALGGALGQRLAAHRLTESQFGVLDALYHRGAMPQCDLARKILRTTGNVTLVVDNLERRGLVHRVRRSDDRRYVEVRLTDAGRTLLEAVLPGHAAHVAEQFRVLSAEEQRTLVGLCRRLAGANAPSPRATRRGARVAMEDA
ncbi:MAG: MarR family transcriptional regulator [Gemmatimonadales bacterium]|jgi:MarR family 2-MHQ and catechol resistance regulon transcriptional repressor|nr:MarR family transcriptional regulator [Gemmatimonadales bacterium]